MARSYSHGESFGHWEVPEWVVYTHLVGEDLEVFLLLVYSGVLVLGRWTGQVLVGSMVHTQVSVRFWELKVEMVAVGRVLQWVDISAKISCS